MKPVVLCVEDDEDIQRILDFALGTLGGFDVLHAIDAMDALAQLKNITPSLLLLDLMLPGMSGLELLDEVRKQPRLQQVPAVLLTAKLNDIESKINHHAGLSAIISKPFDPLILADKIRTYI